MQIDFEKIQRDIEEIKSKLSGLLEKLSSAKTKEDEKELLTVKDCAKFLNLTVSTIYTKTSNGELPVHKRGKRSYYLKSELIEWIKTN